MSLTDDQIVAKNYQDFYNRLKPYLGFTHGAFTPIGTIVPIIGTTAPAHYLACDGSTHSIAAYPELAEYFKDQFGASNHFGGDGTTTFAVPDIGGIPMDSVYCIAVRNIYYDPANYYSTGEQVVGKWIDGKPLYQKTIIVNNPARNTWVTFGPSLTGCHFLGISGSVCFSSGFTCNVPYAGGDFNVFINKKMDANGGELVYNITTPSEIPTIMSVTFQYTKNTD